MCDVGLPTGIGCYMPANGESICIPCLPDIPIDISLQLLKRKEPVSDPLQPEPKRSKLVHGALVYTEDVRAFKLLIFDLYHMKEDLVHLYIGVYRQMLLFFL